MTEENTPPTLAPDGGGVAWHRRRRTRILGTIMVVVAVIGGLGFVVPAQWAGRLVPGNSDVDEGAVAFRPGSARVVGEGVDITGTETFEPEGQILFTTVSIDDNLSRESPGNRSRVLTR